MAQRTEKNTRYQKGTEMHYWKSHKIGALFIPFLFRYTPLQWLYYPPPPSPLTPTATPLPFSYSSHPQKTPTPWYSNCGKLLLFDTQVVDWWFIITDICHIFHYNDYIFYITPSMPSMEVFFDRSGDGFHQKIHKYGQICTGKYLIFRLRIVLKYSTNMKSVVSLW